MQYCKSSVFLYSSIYIQSTDAEEFLDGCPSFTPGWKAGDIDLSSSDIELSRSFQGCYNEQLVGLRFQAVTIDPGTPIISAAIEFTVDTGDLGRNGVNDPVSITIAGENHTDPTTFVSGGVGANNRDISLRTYFPTTVSWSPEVWTATPGVYQTADISDIVQLMVDLPGWANGNAMVFKMYGPSSNPGTRFANSFDSPFVPPKLLIQAGVERRERKLTQSVPTSLLSFIVRRNFTGASGPVSFGSEFTNGRNAEGITVGVYHLQPQPPNSLTGNRTYDAVLASTWNESAGLVFRDGSSYPTGVLRRILFHNYIWHSSRVIGLSLMLFSWLLSISSIVLIQWLRKEPAIQRAQPIFMQILCIGSVVLSSAIFTVSFDEDAGWSNRQLSIACSVTPWLFFVGHSLILSSLFVKLWRVDRYFHFEQKAVAVGYAGTVHSNFKAALVTSWVYLTCSPAPHLTQCDHFWLFLL